MNRVNIQVDITLEVKCSDCGQVIDLEEDDPDEFDYCMSTIQYRGYWHIGKGPRHTINHEVECTNPDCLAILTLGGFER